MAKLTAQQELFAQEYIKCGNATQSYKKAYPRALEWKDRAIWNNASKILNNTGVMTRVKELQEEAKERNKITVDTILAELEEARQKAMGDEKPSHASAQMISASMGKAKLLGLDKQIVDHQSSDGSMSPQPTLTLGDFYKEQ